MANVLGKEPFKIMYLDGTWKTINASFEVYDSKYTYNIKDEVKMKNLDFDRINFYKGSHHKFEITYHKMDVTKIQELRLMQSKQVRFYPHTDSSAYYTVNCTLVKPFYIKNYYSTDGCKVTFETDRYQEIILKDTPMIVSECFSMNDLNGVGMNGNYLTLNGDCINQFGLLGNSIRLTTSSSYLSFPNYEKATEWTFHTWFSIPYSVADFDDFFSIGALGGAPYSVRIYRNNGWTSVGGNITINVEGADRATFFISSEDWHLISIKAFGNQLHVYFNGVLKTSVARSTGSIDYFRLGVGIGKRDFDIRFDETVLFKTPCIKDNTDTLAMYNQGKGIVIDLPKFYLS